MIIGIDLGTTNSLAAYFTEEGPKIIPNRLGKRLTPSVVSIDEDEQVYVGEVEAERMLLYPDSAASVFKRDMGSKKQFKLLNKTFLAEELSSLVLRVLKEDAQEYLGEEVTEAVISVPAYFDDARRRATKRAGELAGRPPAAELTELLFVCMRGMCYDWCISNGAYDLQERMTSQMSLLIRAFVP